MCDENKIYLFSQLAHSETLQHQRVYYFLVAETIFLMGASTVAANSILLCFLSLAGLAITVLFTFTNVKQNLRAQLLLKKLCDVDGEYLKYSRFDGISDFSEKQLGKHNSWARKHLLYQNPEQKRFYQDTGWLYTWGLFWITGVLWLVFLIYGICQGFPKLCAIFKHL